MRNRDFTVSATLALCIALAACGGGGERVASANIPPPAPAPTPSPSPSPEPPVPPPPPEGPIGLVSSEPFAALGVSNDFAKSEDGSFAVSKPEKADISLEYRASDGTYVITLPGFDPGALYTTSYNGSFIDSSAWQSISGSSNQLLDGDSGQQDARIFLRWPTGPLNMNYPRLTYTSWGSWGDDWATNGSADAASTGYFAYGIPTAAGDVPTTGSATYNATVIGNSDQAYPGDALYLDYVSGTAQLRFDFGAGTLAGEMRAAICPWDCDIDLGVFTFIETIYSTGSTSFFGSFSQNGEPVDSWFEGNFNGPQAAELMARWSTAFTSGDYTGTVSGIWVGKKE